MKATKSTKPDADDGNDAEDPFAENDPFSSSMCLMDATASKTDQGTPTGRGRPPELDDLYDGDEATINEFAEKPGKPQASEVQERKVESPETPKLLLPLSFADASRSASALIAVMPGNRFSVEGLMLPYQTVAPVGEELKDESCFGNEKSGEASPLARKLMPSPPKFFPILNKGKKENKDKKEKGKGKDTKPVQGSPRGKGLSPPKKVEEKKPSGAPCKEKPSGAASPKGG